MSFVKKPTQAVIFGGLFFIIPFIILIFVIKMALKLLKPFGGKIDQYLGIHTILGEAAITIISLILLLFICYVAGLLLQRGLVKDWGGHVEEKLFLFFPSLQVLKYRLLGEEYGAQSKWTGILLKEDDHYTLAFITNPITEPYLSIFIPEIPKMDAGEIRYMKKGECVYHTITMHSAMNAVISFGAKGNAWSVLADSPIKEGKSDI